MFMQHHNDTTIKTDARRKTQEWRTQEGKRRKTSLTKNIPLTLLQGFERVVQGLHVRGCWRPNINFIFWPHCRVWPSLPHLVSRCLEFYWQLLWHQTQLNYIIIQRPHDRPVDLWNRMFNRHQAEITVMQFRGYSLPVHHCSGTMGLLPCPIS